MVLSDGMVHFLKIENFFNKSIFQNYLVALKYEMLLFFLSFYF